jgi:hypothetical protein
MGVSCSRKRHCSCRRVEMMTFCCNGIVRWQEGAGDEVALLFFIGSCLFLP